MARDLSVHARSRPARARAGSALLPLAAAALIAGCGEDRAEPAARAPNTTSEDLVAVAGGIERLVGPSSTCGSGTPRDVVLACGIQAAHPRHRPLPVAPGQLVELRFRAKVGRLLVQRKRAGRTGPVEELTQLTPVSGSPDGRRWAIRAPSRMAPKTVIGLVVLFDDPVYIRRLSTGGTVPVRDAMLQYQLPLRARR